MVDDVDLNPNIPAFVSNFICLQDKIITTAMTDPNKANGIIAKLAQMAYIDPSISITLKHVNNGKCDMFLIVSPNMNTNGQFMKLVKDVFTEFTRSSFISTRISPVLYKQRRALLRSTHISRILHISPSLLWKTVRYTITNLPDNKLCINIFYNASSLRYSPERLSSLFTSLLVMILGEDSLIEHATVVDLYGFHMRFINEIVDGTYPIEQLRGEWDIRYGHKICRLCGASCDRKDQIEFLPFCNAICKRLSDQIHFNVNETD